MQTYAVVEMCLLVWPSPTVVGEGLGFVHCVCYENINFSLSYVSPV